MILMFIHAVVWISSVLLLHENVKSKTTEKGKKTKNKTPKAFFLMTINILEQLS